ncbi:MAG: hypothetical protein LBM93_15190 [Oscillospiraceae bacterium]|jgi:hypothetical protein|nr:hypothetical protein [Oscillospiraceae bacterium]
MNFQSKFTAKNTNETINIIVEICDKGIVEKLSQWYDGHNYGQRFLAMEKGTDKKWHFKFTIHNSRTSLVSDNVSSVEQAIMSSFNLTEDSEKLNSSDIYKWMIDNVVCDFYLIGDWSRTGKWENGKMELIK